MECPMCAPEKASQGFVECANIGRKHCIECHKKICLYQADPETTHKPRTKVYRNPF